MLVTGGYYKQLIALYHRLGVKFRHADFSYSFSALTPTAKGILDLRTYFIYNGSSGAKGVSFPKNNPYCLAQNFGNQVISFFYSTLATMVILFIYIRLLFLASPIFRPQPLVTFHQWVSQTTPKGILARWTRFDAFWREFSQEVLLPMFSAVCTAPEEDVHSHPMAEFLGSWPKVNFNIYLHFRRIYMGDNRQSPLRCPARSPGCSIAFGSIRPTHPFIDHHRLHNHRFLRPKQIIHPDYRRHLHRIFTSHNRDAGQQRGSLVNLVLLIFTRGCIWTSTDA